MIGVAGTLFRLTLTDGRVLEVRPSNGDELRFERLSKTSLTRVIDEGSVPAWMLLGIVHGRLLRDGTADIPADADDFADLLASDGFEVVDTGKAGGSDPIPPIG